MDAVVGLNAAAAFELITDFGVHGRWIPLTRMDVPRRPLRPGDLVVARSAGFFEDRMRIIELTPPEHGRPGVARVRKEGPVLLGDATITVTPEGGAAARVQWQEDVWLAGPLPRPLTKAILAPAFGVMLALAFRALRRDAAALSRVQARRVA